MRLVLLFLCIFATTLASAPAAAQQFQYDNAGRLTAALYADGASIRYEYDAASNITRVQYIAAPEALPPDGAIDTPADDVTVDAGQSVNFTGTGSDPDGAVPLTFLWDFDGAAPNSNDEDPGDVTFASAGTYTVEFTVSDATNLADPSPDTVVITVNPAPPSGSGGGSGGDGGGGGGAMFLLPLLGAAWLLARKVRAAVPLLLLVLAGSANAQTWFNEASGTDQNLNDVWMQSLTLAYAVGDLGTVVQYDGAVWTPVDVGTTEKLNGVWGTGANDVWIVGARGTVRHYDGTGWAPVDIGAGNASLNDVWTRGAGETVYIVGTLGVWFDSGGGWAKQGIKVSNTSVTLDPNQNFTAIRGSDNYLVLTSNGAFGTDTGLFVDFDWVGLSTFGLEDVWVYDDNFMLAVGEGTRLMDGGDPTNGSSANWQNYGVGLPPRGVWGADPQNIWAVGGSTTFGRITHYDGNAENTWTIEVTESFRPFNGIDGIDAGNVLVVGNLGTIYRLSAPEAGPTAANYPYSGTAEGNVNTYTGEVVYETVDFAIGSDPLEFRRYYTSSLWDQGTVGERLGDNWTHNYEWRLDTNYEGISDRVRITDYRGTEYVFDVGATSNTQVSPTWANVSLTINNGTYILVDHEEERMYAVDTNGLLWIENRNGNRHTLIYNQGYLTSVINGKENQIAFEYTQGGKLARVFVPEGGEELEVAFTYSGTELTAATKSSGAVSDYAYTGAALLTSVSVGGAIRKVWDYGSQDRVIATALAGGGPFIYSYNGNEFLVTEPGATTRRYEHDDEGRLLSMTNGVNTTLGFGYDSDGRRTSVTDGMNRTTSWTYDPVSRKLQTITEPGNFVTRQVYETGSSALGVAFFDLTGIEHPDSTTEIFGYDSNGNMTRYIDENVVIWDLSYDASGNLLQVSNPLGGTTVYTRTLDGLVQTVTDPALNVTEYRYDLFQRLVRVFYPDATQASLVYSTRFVPDQVTYKSGAVENYSYGAGDRISRIDYSDGSFESYTYDEAGDVSSIELPRNQVTTFRYDARRNVDRIVPPDLYFERFEYDAASRLVKYVDPDSNEWLLDYNADDTLREIISPSGEQQLFDYSDDPRGLMTSQTRGSETTRFTYDNRSRLQSITDPLERVFQGSRDDRGVLTSASILPATINKTYERNDVGQIERYVDPNGGEWVQDFGNDGLLRSKTNAANETTTVARDELNRVERTTDSDGATIDLAYAPSGLVQSLSGSDGTSLDIYSTPEGKLLNGTGFWFDYSLTDGRLQATNGIGVEYDSSDRPWRVTLGPGLVLEYLYDQTGNLTTVRDWVGGETTITPTPVGQRDDISYPNGITTDYRFDDRDRLVAINHGTLGSIVLNRSPLNGRINSADRNLPGDVEMQNQDLVFDFDIASREHGSLYDARGNLTFDGSHTFEYDILDRLTSVAVDGSTVELDYDAFGSVVSRSDELGLRQYANNYAFPAPRVTVERDSSGRDLWYYVQTPIGELLYRISPEGVRQYYHFDERGNTVFMTDDDGTVVQTYAYSPVGALLNESGNVDNLFRTLAEFGAMNVTGDVLITPGGNAANHENGQKNQERGATGGQDLLTGDIKQAVPGDTDVSRSVAYDMTQQDLEKSRAIGRDIGINFLGWMVPVVEGNLRNRAVRQKIMQAIGGYPFKININSSNPYSFGRAPGVTSPILSGLGGVVAGVNRYNSDVYETEAGRVSGATLQTVSNTAYGVYLGPAVLAGTIIDGVSFGATGKTTGVPDAAVNGVVNITSAGIDSAVAGNLKPFDNLAGDIVENGGWLGTAANFVSGAAGTFYSMARGDLWEKRRLIAERREMLKTRKMDNLPKPGSQGYLYDLFASWF